MLTTTNLGLKKPQTTDQKTALRTSIGDNADVIETILGARGKCIIATEETRSTNSFGLMTTPDQVTGLVLPQDGLIEVYFHGMMKTTGTANLQAGAIFLNGVQLQQTAEHTPVIADTATSIVNASVYKPVVTVPTGLFTLDPSDDAVAYSGDATTGQIVGGQVGGSGPCVIFAAAGTYTVSVQWKAQTASTITVKNRKLWARVLNYG